MNLDGVVDISDAVNLLGYLFLGAARPGCLDAADTDDSGELDISDAVLALTFLFLQGEPPRPPFPEPGPDPTVDGLPCLK